MTIDPEIDFFLQELRAGWAEHPPFASMTLAEQRAVAEKVRARWTEAGPVMARTVERRFDPGAGELRIRVYLPVGVDEPAPALVYLHGGGFTLFSIDTHDRLMREYAHQGSFAVVGVDYPLAPEHKYPIALDRIEALMLWLKVHGTELGLDPTRIALGGDSAGANMSFGIVQRLRALGQGDLVRAILSNYGGYDAAISDDAEARFGGDASIMNRAEAEEYYGNYLNGRDEADDPHVYPVKAELGGFPPVFLVVAECDILAEQAPAMERRLREAGVETLSRVYRGAIHSFLEAMSVSAVARAAIADGAAFVKDKLKDSELTSRQLGVGGQPPPRNGPLSGVLVLDVTRVVAGPYCSMILADLGATVIKIENPKDPDYTRTFPPMVDTPDGPESAFYAQYNRNKLGVALDLRSAAGKQAFLALAAKADILVENFRPGVMDKFGLGYEALKAVNPRLVYTAISGYGRTGPNANRPGYDNSGQAAGGLWSMNGYAGQPPVRVGTIIGDLSASLYAATGTLAALREAERTGLGQVVDISQQDSVLSLTENAVVRYTVAHEVAGPLGNDHPFVRPYSLFPCADGYVFFGGYTDKFWTITCALFGEPEMARDPRIDTMEKRFVSETYETIVKPLIERWFSTRTKAELEEMAGAEVPISAIKTIDEVIADPHIAARGMIVDVPMGDRQVAMMGMPIKLSNGPDQAHTAPPGLGEHNAAIFRDLLGMTDAEIAALGGAEGGL